MSLLGGADESVKMSTSPTLLLDTRSAVHSTAAVDATATAAAEPTAAASAGDWSAADETDEQRLRPAAQEDVTAELSAPARAAGLGRVEWQLLAAAGLGVGLFMLLALALAYCRTAAGPALRKAVHDDAECPPLLDYAAKPLDFAKYLGKQQSILTTVVVDRISGSLPPRFVVRATFRPNRVFLR